MLESKVAIPSRSCATRRSRKESSIRMASVSRMWSAFSAESSWMWTISSHSVASRKRASVAIHVVRVARDQHEPPAGIDALVEEGDEPGVDGVTDQQRVVEVHIHMAVGEIVRVPVHERTVEPDRDVVRGDLHGPAQVLVERQQREVDAEDPMQGTGTADARSHFEQSQLAVAILAQLEEPGAVQLQALGDRSRVTVERARCRAACASPC